MPDLHTGPYAVFIWPAYAITVAIFTAMVANTLLRARFWRAQAEKRAEKKKDAAR